MKTKSNQTTKKHGFRKNQIIITTLALMIVVAGYLNFAGKKADTASTKALSDGAVEEDPVLELSEEDIESQAGLEQTQGDDILVANEEEGDELPVEDVTATEGETAKNSGETAEDAGQTAAENMETDDLATQVEQSDETPGEAVLTNATGIVAGARLNRDQVRSQNRETLQEMIDSTSVTEAQRQSAVDSMLRMTQNAETEVAAETLLQAKGFTDVIVSITDTSVDVVVNETALSEAQLAQIEDIVKRKTGRDASGIVITTVAE